MPLSPKQTKTRNMPQRTIKLLPMSDYGYDCYEHVQTPSVSKESIEIYKKYIETPERIKNSSLIVQQSQDKNLIYKYVHMK